MNKRLLIYLTLLFCCIALTICLAVFLSSRFGSNILTKLVSGDQYQIPEESSYFTFEVIEANQGSGEWWIYGKDDKNFYYYNGVASSSGNIKISKDDALQCNGFDPIKISTWCGNKESN